MTLKTANLLEANSLDSMNGLNNTRLVFFLVFLGGTAEELQDTPTMHYIMFIGSFLFPTRNTAVLGVFLFSFCLAFACLKH